MATEEISYFIVIYFKQNHEKFAFECKSLTLATRILSLIWQPFTVCFIVYFVKWLYL
jgi:hypothetical protein